MLTKRMKELALVDMSDNPCQVKMAKSCDCRVITLYIQLSFPRHSNHDSRYQNLNKLFWAPLTSVEQLSSQESLGDQE
jgi:hypothetical protein